MRNKETPLPRKYVNLQFPKELHQPNQEKETNSRAIRGLVLKTIYGHEMDRSQHWHDGEPPLGNSPRSGQC